jgi:DNA-binding transcriptional LysR family regulator
VFIVEEGSFTKAAERVGRTQSAVTLQVQKLEALLRQPLVVRAKGGPVELTAQGRRLLDSARTMLALNDEVFREVDARDLPATVRLGTSSAFAPYYVARTLEALRAEYPNVLVEVTNGYSCQIAPRIKDGVFDLVLCEGDHEPRNWEAKDIWRGPLLWITSETHEAHRRDPLPLCLAPGDCPWRPAWMEDCFWRFAAMRALERAGRPYRIVASAGSMEGLYAPVMTGEAITVSFGGKLPPGLRMVGPDEGLPSLPDTRVVLIKGRGAPQPITDALAEAITSTFSMD